MLKVGGQEQNIYISAMPGGLNTKLGSSKHGKAKHSTLGLLLMASKVGGQEQFFFSFGHAWDSKHRAWKFKAWPMQTFWFSTSYFQSQT